VLVTAWSETVALALETAWRLGKAPAVFLPEGLPDLDGRRLARRLSRAGVAVTLAYDSAVLSLVPRVDRVWLSTEAIGAGAFLARSGTRVLLEECARRDVPVRVLATSDKLVPGGRLELPSWAERETWRLWEDAPEGVRIESQFHEAVPTALLEQVGGFLTEIGPEAVAAMHVRALRVEAEPVLESAGLQIQA
jgi:translation initiation factor 2B subunit (eIF-2B alpha/beta/delta family)